MSTFSISHYPLLTLRKYFKGGPPPLGFVETTQQPPPYSIQSIPIQQPIPNNNQQYPINYTTSSGQTYVTVAAATHSPPVVLMGGCPACRVSLNVFKRI